jgi:hypothetical protein
MAKLLLAKMASAAALVSTSFMLNGCWTIAGRPILCDFGYTMKDGRCAKVAKVKAYGTQPDKPSKPGPGHGGANSGSNGGSHY